ncbi:hypothetical protein MHYP_G00108040 [Metynnis hypsauchen]
MMAQAVIIILLLYKIYSVPAVRNSEPLVISAEPGKEVTLNCTFADDSSADVRTWYKQSLEHVPLEVGSKMKDRAPVMSPHFNQTRFKIDRIASGISLRIKAVTKEDEGMYFCGLDRQNVMDFSNATFLAVTEKAQEGAVNERTTRQEQNPENLHYAAIHIKEKKAKGPARTFLSALLCFTESWLTESTPVSALQLHGLNPYRADRSTELSAKKKGGGICFNINQGWCEE